MAMLSDHFYGFGIPKNIGTQKKVRRSCLNLKNKNPVISVKNGITFHENYCCFYFISYEHTTYIKNEQALTLGTGGF